MEQIRQAWEDDLDFAAPIGYQICQPQPPRGPEEIDISLDIIMSQGLHLWRYSGLVTVSFLDDLEGNTRFHVANSFTREVSGYDIVDAVDLHHLCSPIAPRRCSITHGWTPIPVSTDRLHRMRSGHAFVIFVPADAAGDPHQTMRQVEQAPVEAQTFAAIPMQNDPSHDSPEPSEGEEEGDGEDDPPLPDHGAPPNLDEELRLFNCHIYRLHHQPMHLFLRRVSGVPLMCELARHLNLPREVFVATYPIWVRMVGQHVDDWSILVQHVDDIPAASTDCLVILDVEIHFPAIVGALPALPATTRRVLRVPPYITRPLVLRYAGVYQFCTVQHDRCLVTLDNVGWPLRLPGPRRVRHGSYLRVVVPPSSDGNPNTLEAIRLVETHVAQLLQAPAAAPFPAPPHVGPVPPAPAPPQPAPRNHHFLRRWTDELMAVFEEMAHIECEDEGPVLYAQVWFINHVLFRECRLPLAAKLLNTPGEWFEQVIELWRMHLQPGVPVDMHVVSPHPPRTSFQSFQVHILIEQQVCAARAANVISFHLQDFASDKLWQSAFSMPRRVSTADLVDLTSFNHLCETRRCHAVCGRMNFNNSSGRRLRPV